MQPEIYSPYFGEELRASGFSKFVSYSGFIHGLVVLILFGLSQNVSKTVIPKMISIEIINSVSLPPKGLTLDTPRAAKDLVVKEEKSPKIDLKNPGLRRAPIKVAPQARPVKSKTIASSKPKAVARQLAPVAPIQALPATINDIQEPNVEDFGREQEIPAQLNLQEEELQKDFAHIDQASEQEARKARSLLVTSSEDAEQEVETSVEKLKSKNMNYHSSVAQRSNKFGKISGRLQAKADGELNSEIGQLEGFAGGLGNNIQDIVEEGGGTEEKGDGSGYGTKKGNGNYAGTPAYGRPNGVVRSLGDLKQKPGNAKPQYSVEDRLRRRQGQVIYMAYVQKDGSVSNFKLLQTSGFSTLDERTLSALKRWKFYPGQEGWVELPFRWDLKGGIKEIPALLRANRAVTVN